MTSELENLVDGAESIGVIGSPSSTSKLLIDILGRAADKRLVGTLSTIKFQQEGKVNYALGQITEVTLINPFVQDPTMRGLIRQRGNVPPITEKQDTHTAEVLISSVFEESDGKIDSSTFSTVPSTGTNVRMITQPIVDLLVKPYSKEISYIGKIFGTDILLPSMFKHFGEVSSGGWGEAVHIGIFGKSGSGKSFLAKMIVASYLKHKAMTILIIDPQGEFSKMKKDQTVVDYVENKLGRKMEFYDLSEIVMLPDMEIFKKILIKSNFLKDLGVRHIDNQQDGADQIERILNHEWGHSIASTIASPVPLDHAHTRAVFEHVWERLLHTRRRNNTDVHVVLERIYTSDTGRNRVLGELQDTENDPTRKDSWFQRWRNLTNLFGRENISAENSLSTILQAVGEKKEGRLLVINLSEASVPENLFWDPDIQKISINQILQEINNVAKMQFLKEGALNAMIVLDEAHEFAPRERYQGEETNLLRDTLTKAVRETRKYNLGWMFISQTLSSLDRRIIEQLRMYFVGYGLAYGIELQGIRELLSGNDSAIHFYQQFKDPKSSFTTPQYSFMALGPSSPMSFSLVPLFFNSLDYPPEFIKVNSKTA